LAVPLPVGVLSLVVQLADWLALRVQASPVKLKALVLIQVAEVRWAKKLVLGWIPGKAIR
jgi:hypothetical protein